MEVLGILSLFGLGTAYGMGSQVRLARRRLVHRANGSFAFLGRCFAHLNIASPSITYFRSTIRYSPSFWCTPAHFRLPPSVLLDSRVLLHVRNLRCHC